LYQGYKNISVVAQSMKNNVINNIYFNVF